MTFFSCGETNDQRDATLLSHTHCNWNHDLLYVVFYCSTLKYVKSHYVSFSCNIFLSLLWSTVSAHFMYFLGVIFSRFFVPILVEYLSIFPSSILVIFICNFCSQSSPTRTGLVLRSNNSNTLEVVTFFCETHSVKQAEVHFGTNACWKTCK